MSTEWLDALRSLDPQRPTALVGVLATEGSAPRGPGTRVLVDADGTSGTIGGGALEYRAVEQAQAILTQPPGTWRVQDYPLGPLLGQCCGGRVRLLIEHVDPHALGWLDDIAAEPATLVSTLGDRGVVRRIDAGMPPAPASARGERPGVGATFAERIGQPYRPLYLFGAGHVGKAIAHHARRLPLRLAWFDTRPAFAATDGVALVAEDDIARCAAEAPEDAAVVILTHDHALDYRLTRAALARAPAFVGLIGSATKRARFLSRLADDGVDAAGRARLTCPIGVEGIDGNEPDVIAIATLAQILRLGTS